MKNLTVETAKDFLKSNGYFVDNLWHIDDVKNVCNCTDEEAQKILCDSLTNEELISQINCDIEDNASMMGFEIIDTNNED